MIPCQVLCKNIGTFKSMKIDGFMIERMQSKGVTTSSYERTADGELRWEVH